MRCQLCTVAFLFCHFWTAASDDPPPSLRVIGIRDIAYLSLDEATSIAGFRAKFRVWLWTEPDEFQGQIIYGCWSPSRIDRTMFFVPGTTIDEDEKPLVVERVIRILHHDAFRSIPA